MSDRTALDDEATADGGSRLHTRWVETRSLEGDRIILATSAHVVGADAMLPSDRDLGPALGREGSGGVVFTDHLTTGGEGDEGEDEEEGAESGHLESSRCVQSVFSHHGIPADR